MTTRDIEAAMKAALVQEYEAYVRAGRKDDAEYVAVVLKDEYGHDVAKKDDGDAEKAKKPEPAPERADAEKAPENTAEPKPRRAPRAKPAESK